MTVPVIQAHYEQLERIANTFRDQQEVVASQQRAIQQTYQPLAQGGWQGKGSQAFISEMEEEMFPALDRLHYALSEGEATVRQIIAIMRAAEQEASQPFRNGFGDAVGATRTLGAGARAGAGAHINGSSNTEAGAHINGSSNTEAGAHIADSVGRDGIVRPVIDVHSLFTDQKLQEMIGKSWRGDGTAQLRNAMNVLNGNPTPEQVEKALDDIAEARGIDRKKIAADYEVFKRLKQQTLQGPPVEQLNPIIHHSYMGSRDQLRSGDIIGQAFGIDAVFGALLNPTGGMAGAGEKAIPTNESAVGLHSATHDAAGFLYNHFNLGPGYDYLNREPSRDRAHGFTGQESGLHYWKEIMSQRGLQHQFWDAGNIATTAGSAMGAWVDFQQTPVYKVGRFVWDTTQLPGKVVQNVMRNVMGFLH